MRRSRRSPHGSRPAAPVRGSWRIASGWRVSASRGSATGRTGAGRCPGSATRPRASSSSGSPPRRTAATARDASSPATRAVTGSTGRSTPPASRASRRRSRATPANRPTREEIARCRPFLVEELERLTGLRVVVVLGRVAHDGFLAALVARGVPVARPRPRFAHGAVHALANGLVLVCSYHPSQQNTFTGKLTRPMLDAVFRRARRALDRPSTACACRRR